MASTKSSPFKRFLRKTLKVLLWMFIASNVYLIVCKWMMPPITITQIANSFSYGLKRDYVSWNEISYNAKLAAIASEDQAFPDHGGFDWDAIEKSLKPKKKGKKSKIPLGGGASTLTQQVAKNVFLWQGSGIGKYIRKVPEMYYTKMIEWIWGKQRILEIYLNTIEMGPGVFGIEAAAQYYFHKPAKNLTRSEAAAIVAIFPNPKLREKKVNTGSWKQGWIMRQMTAIEDDEDVQAIIK